MIPESIAGHAAHVVQSPVAQVQQMLALHLHKRLPFGVGGQFGPGGGNGFRLFIRQFIFRGSGNRGNRSGSGFLNRSLSGRFRRRLLFHFSRGGGSLFGGLGGFFRFRRLFPAAFLLGGSLQVYSGLAIGLPAGLFLGSRNFLGDGLAIGFLGSRHRRCLYGLRLTIFHEQRAEPAPLTRL